MAVNIAVDGEEEFYQKIGQFEGAVNQVAEHLRSKLGPEEIAKYQGAMDAYEANAKETLTELNVALQQTESNRLATAQRVTGFVNQAYGIFNQVLGVFGQSIGGVLGALISAAFTTATTLMSMAAAQASNPWTAATAVLTLISATLTVTAAIQAEQDKQKIMAEVEATKAMVARPTSTRITVRL